MNSNHIQLEDLYVIASVYNPASYKSRTDLYYQFEEHMKNSGVKLITIECIYGLDNEEFYVTHKDNPNHIQMKTNHPLWHKENLINIAIKKLPINWKYVLWLDADIEFLQSDWVIRVKKAFEEYDIIQVFKYAHFLGPDSKTSDTHFSFAYSIVEELPISKNYYKFFYPHPGCGWGMNRKAYEHLNGLLDWSILGSGDSHMAFSMIGRYSESMGFSKNMYTENYWKMIKKWQEKVKYFADNKRIGYADCIIQHHFHGFRQDRQYINRMRILIENQYDPIKDLITTENGLYQLRNDRKSLIDQICLYFNSRKEDKKENTTDTVSIQNEVKTPEEILEAALYVKKLIAIERFKKITKEFSRPKKLKKRSKSVIENKKKKIAKKSPKPKKIFIIELSSDINNFLSDSEGSSTYGDKSDSSSQSEFLSIDEKNSPGKSRRGSIGDEMMMQCGSCFSNKSVEERKNKSNKESDKGKNYSHHNKHVVSQDNKIKSNSNMLNNNNANNKNGKKSNSPAPIVKVKKDKSKKKNKMLKKTIGKILEHGQDIYDNNSHSSDNGCDDYNNDNNFNQNDYY